ncbi:MAG: hypothetical protein IPM16_03920 [Chloroflexi bacterium]|nr:hypothetical protein [Chloroflexota bacterium]
MIPTGLAPQLARHLPRLLLAILWAIGAEVLLWSYPPDRSVIDWILTLAGYGVLAYALVDLAIRWRLRDLYGVAPLGGLAALLYALVVNPQFTLIDIPRTLVTRAMGSHALLFMGMLLLWLVMLRAVPLQRLLVPLAALIGVCWGTWVRYAPILTDIPGPTLTDPTLFLIVGIGVVALIGGVGLIGSRTPLARGEALLMQPAEAVVVGFAAIALVYRQLDLGAIDLESRGLVVGLIGLCLAMLWFRKDTSYGYLVGDVRVDPPWGTWFAGMMAFLIGASVAFSAPIIGDDSINQVAAIAALFTLFGAIWLPGVSVILGLRAVLRQVSSTPL